VFVSVASIAVGMMVSAVRWATIDSLHRFTGLPRPTWNDAALIDRLLAFEALVDAHFRYYQHHANMAVALVVAFVIAVWSGALPGSIGLWFIGFGILESLYLATSRNNLSHYYRRVSRLLGESPGKKVKHVQRSQTQESAEVDGLETH